MLENKNQESGSWTDHRGINMVCLRPACLPMGISLLYKKFRCLILKKDRVAAEGR